MVLPLMPILGAVVSTYLVTTEIIKPSGAVTETDKEVVSKLRTVVGKVSSIESKLDGLAVGEGDKAHSATYGELLTKLGEVNSKLTTNKERYDRVLGKLSAVSTAESDRKRHDGVLAKLRQASESESELIPTVRDLNGHVTQMLKDMAIPQGRVRKGRVLRLERLASMKQRFTILANKPRQSMTEKEVKEYERLHVEMIRVSKQLADSKELDYTPVNSKVSESTDVSTPPTTTTPATPVDPRTAMVDKFLKEFGLTRELVESGSTPTKELGRMATEINRLEAKLREPRYAKPKTQADTTASLNYSYRLLGVKVAHRYITDGYRWDASK